MFDLVALLPITFSFRLVFVVYLLFFIFFFFSSRRRHTRCLSDWSSDVCSSDLQHRRGDCGSGDVARPRPARRRRHLVAEQRRDRHVMGAAERPQREGGGGGEAVEHGKRQLARSEERRVGKEGRWAWARER